MAITRATGNQAFNLVDHVESIEQIDRQNQIIPVSMFDMRPTTQTAVVFDISKTETTLMPATNRGGRAATVGSDDAAQMRSLPLSWSKIEDTVTQEDVLGVRRVGTANGLQTVDLAKAEKLEKLARIAQQTEQFMLTRAVFQGMCVSPDGVEYADMFAELGITQQTFDLDLGDAGTDVPSKIRQIKRMVRDSLTNGGISRGVEIYLNSDLYEKVVSHSTIQEAYKYYQANNPQPLRDDVTDMFRTNGVTLYAIDGSFKLPTGSNEDVIASGTGHVVPLTDNMWRGWYGPSDRLSHAHNPAAVSEFYAWEHDSGDDTAVQMFAAMSRLFIPTQPNALIKVISST